LPQDIITKNIVFYIRQNLSVKKLKYGFWNYVGVNFADYSE